MNKTLKIGLVSVGVLSIIVGGGYFIYKKYQLYKDKSVRDEEKKFVDFGSLIENAQKRHSDVYIWYEELPVLTKNIIEESFYNMSKKEKDVLVKGFGKRELTEEIKQILSKMGYNK